MKRFSIAKEQRKLDRKNNIANTLLTNKHMYCFNCSTSNETDTYTLFNGTDSCHNATPTADCAKEGNGLARITLIEKK